MYDKLNLNYKIWLEKDGKVFGEGPYELLKYIQSEGSLRRASQKMNMSYSLAHKLIKDLEARLGSKLIDRTIGGEGGGGSSLTPTALSLLTSYESFIREADESLQKLFKKHFNK